MAPHPSPLPEGEGGDYCFGPLTQGCALVRLPWAIVFRPVRGFETGVRRYEAAVRRTAVASEAA